MNQPENDSPIFSASQALAHRWQHSKPPGILPPDTVILCYQPNLMNYVRRSYPIKHIAGFFGEVYLLKASAGEVAVSGNFGIGSPSAVIQMEELAAFGARRFISIGLAGSLQSENAPGDWMVCTSAIRDEGTSAHYLPGAQQVFAGEEMSKFLKLALGSSSSVIPFHTGPIWTTDAPYRETQAEIKTWQKQGVCAVDMEIAALFAAGQVLGVETGAAVVLADQISPEGWHPPVNMQVIQRNLEMMLKRLMEALLKEARSR
jgi:uridine phosphorylase